MAAGGFKMSLGGLKAKPGLKGAGLKSSATQNTHKPKKALLGDDEPDTAPQTQEIAGFDVAAGGAIDINGPAEKKGPLVIPSLPNRNWREEARKRQLEKAPHTQLGKDGGDVVMEEQEKEVVYGLTVPSRPSEGEGQENGADAEAMDVDVEAGKGEDSHLTDAQRLEKAALEHLLNGKSTDTQRVVPAITDEEALANDLVDAPDEPSLDAYEATPIEGFGLAMLRGMGWKDSDGESRGKNAAKAPKEVKRRPALLGIGAKEDAAKDVELGEFNSKARPKKGHKDKDAPTGYTPVTLRNKKTGEVISEADLKRKLESQEMLGEAQDKPDSDREGKKDRRSDKDRDRRRYDDDDYDSERRRDREGKDSRRRDKYDDDTSYRRREKRRERDDDYDSERRGEKRRDRSRSRSPRDAKRRDRYRSRSRDSKDRRSRRDRSRSRSRDDKDRRRHRNERDDGRRRDKDERSSRR